MATIYTLGIQPIEILSRKYTLVDLLNQAVSDIEEGVPLYSAVLNTIQNLKLSEDDYVFVNSYRAREFLPFFPVDRTILLDPAYVPHEEEFRSQIGTIKQIIGTPPTYLNAANACRSAVLAKKEQMKVSTFYNCLTLLTDLNKSNITVFEEFLLSLDEKPSYSRKVSALFVGDLIHPDFFENLATKGVFVESFLPFSDLLAPVDDPVSYYSDFILFQPMFSLLLDIKRLIREKNIRTVIFNPQGFYLTPTEATFLSSKLPDTINYILPPGYKGLQIDVSILL